jgi:hypothetical protein
MSKGKALLKAVIAFGLAFLFLYWQINGCFFIFLLISLPFAVIAALKYRRDWRITAEAEQLQYLPPPAVLPPMSSPNSNRLFVPPPLDRRP